MLIYFTGQTFPPVPFSGARLEVCNLWEAICQCKEREQKSLSLNEGVYLPLILLIGFLTKYCRAQQRAALSSIQELLISTDKTSSFIVGFQRIVKFLKASGKKWFLFFFFVLFLQVCACQSLDKVKPCAVYLLAYFLALLKVCFDCVGFLLCTFKQQLNFNNTCEKLHRVTFMWWLAWKQLSSVTYIPTSSCQLRYIVLTPLDSSYTNCTCVGSTCQILNVSTQPEALKILFPWFVFIPPFCSVSS